MSKKIKLQSGSFNGDSKVAEGGLSLDKKALMVYVGQFDSMEGPVEIKDEHIDKLAGNHNTLHMAEGEIAHYPPIQLDHSTSAKDTVGRLIGHLEVGTHKLKDGTEVKALYGTVRMLGKENVERVQDGRWTNLSIGADLEEGKITELTITPFPAAPEATLLSKGEPMKEKMKKHLMEHYKMSDEQADAHMKKCAKHLMDQEKLASEEEADKKLEAMDEEGSKKLAAEVKDKEDKLAAESVEKEKKDKEAKDVEAKKATLAAAREQITQLSTDFRATSKSVELAAKKAKLQVRLSRLKADAKITPAEVKKVDLAKLAGESDATIAAVFKTYEDREPVIFTNLFGSRKGIALSEVHKQARVTQLEAETRANMPFLAAADKNSKLALGDEGTTGQQAVVLPVETQPHVDMTSEHEADMANHCKMLDEGRIPEAKEHLKKLMEKYAKYGAKIEGDVTSATENEMSALDENVKKMHTQFDQVMQLVSTLASDQN